MLESNQMQKKSNTTEPKIGRTILDDLRRGDLKRTWRREWRELKTFYLDEDRSKRLAQMGWFRRWLWMLFYLLKSLFFKLTPLRRLFFVLAFILFLSGDQINVNTDEINIVVKVNQISFSLLLLVLMLELKDKLVARSELEAGRVVQKALMPEKNPQLTGWDIWLYTQPANDVGGDLVDYLVLDEDRLGIFLGDVAGKGLPAALYMARLQATLRALIPEMPTLEALGQKINTIFCRDSLPNRFASLLYLVLGSDSAEVELLNAGHLPPLRVSQRQVFELPKGSPALGLQTNTIYQPQRVEIKSDEFLLIYSDGVTEAQNEAGKFFGEQRLWQLLPRFSRLNVEAIGLSLLKEIANFTGDARQSDDISLVVIRRKYNSTG